MSVLRRVQHVAFRVLVAGLGLWEFLAVTTRKIPTITAVVHRYRGRRVGRYIVWAVLGGFAWHLLIQK